MQLTEVVYVRRDLQRRYGEKSIKSPYMVALIARTVMAPRARRGCTFCNVASLC